MKSSKKLGSRCSSSDESRLIVEKIPHSVALQLHRTGAPNPILQHLNLAVQDFDPRLLAASAGADLLIVLKNSLDVGFSLLHFRCQQDVIDVGDSHPNSSGAFGRLAWCEGRSEADVKWWCKTLMDRILSWVSRPLGCVQARWRGRWCWRLGLSPDRHEWRGQG